MANIKRFLILYVVGYMIIATGINMIFGPPSMSAEYLAEYKGDHDFYLEATKNSEYKRWKQRPDLIADTDGKLQNYIVFVDEYEAREAFQEEEDRLHIYTLLFEFFNAGMVVVLVGALAKGPVVKLVDGMIASMRETLDETATVCATAAERLDAAEHKIAGLDEDLAGYAELVKERIEHIRRDAALLTGQSLSRFNKEVENRKHNEETKARQQLKEIAVDAAIAQLLEKFKSNGCDEHNQALVAQFVAELEKSS